MSSLVEIQSAAKLLSLKERQQLLILVAESLRAEPQELPKPREFTNGDLNAWLDEDEQDMQRLRNGR
ncbi:MAG: hypothetical protein H7144_17235 [Burkholderiales bacterium]|nr:hypothetical protein [Phycisphaerae bacterium]